MRWVISGSGIAFDAKADLSPVTAADRECERSIAGSLETSFPQDGLLGEEGAQKQSTNGRRWIIDPIDGTRDFVRGNTAWAVLLGLEADGEVVAGVAHFPATNETYFAARGEGAFVNDERMHVSSVARAEDAVLCLNGFNSVIPISDGHAPDRVDAAFLGRAQHGGLPGRHDGGARTSGSVD